MKAFTTTEGNPLGAGKVLNFVEQAGVYFIGDLAGDGKGDAPTVEIEQVEEWEKNGLVTPLEKEATDEHK